MGKGNRKRKKGRKSKGKYLIEDENDSSEAFEDEIVALTSIFQDDLKLVSERPWPQISLTVRAQSADNRFYSEDVSVELLLKCFPGYPYKAPRIQVKPEEGLLEEEDLERLHSMLRDQANSNAREGREAIFNLAVVTQEFLSEIIPASAPVTGSDTVQSTSETISGQTSLFPEGCHMHIIVELFEGLSMEGTRAWEASTEEELDFPKDNSKNPNRMQDANMWKKIEGKHGLHFSLPDPVGRLTENGRHDASQFELLEEESEHATDDLSNKVSGVSVRDILNKIYNTLISTGRQIKRTVRKERPVSINNSGSEEDDFFQINQRPSSENTSILSAQKDLLMVYLLRLACSPKGPLPNVIPELVSQLHSIGIVPEWARELAILQPRIFEKTFRFVFHSSTIGPSDPLLTDFWKASSKLLGEQSSSSGSNSRYLKDFREKRLLGRGSFGHVVLCENRLDRREYAVKKIKLKDKSLFVNRKILREVTTLSSVQHNHVVRYFQAWIETGVASNISVNNGGSSYFQSSDSESSEENISADLLDSKDSTETTYLYIQMEYCRWTLRQVFDSNDICGEKEYIWHLFRQIVEGLAHIHAQGIIHRDLTPNNIFFDFRKDIKIGDFGLAKFTDQQVDREPIFGSEMNGSVDGTGQVGTYFYTAPEIEKEWPHINEKVDMYSLGVILFELWHPFSTAMERHIILSELKQKALLPQDWEREHPAQAALVKQLIAQNPSERPSAVHVLQNALPPRMEDESLNDVLRTIQASEDTYVFDQILSAIFDEERIFAKAHHQGSQRKIKEATPDCINSSDTDVQGYFIELAKEVFVRHGAHKFKSKLLRIVDDSRWRNSSAVKLLSKSGDMLELLFELRLQFVIWISEKKHTSFRRYEISQVYRRGVGHSAPNAYFQADFDIIGGASALTVAETIKVAMDVIGKFINWEACEIHLNHACIANALWSRAGIKEEPRTDLFKLISHLCSLTPQSSMRKAKWTFVRRQLLQGHHLPESAVEKLQSAERRYTGNVDEAIARLRGALPPDRFVLAAFEEVSQLLTYLRVWKIEKQVTFDALMPPTEEYHRGIYFQIYLSNGNYHHVSVPEAVRLCIGGGYDWLLHQLWNDHQISNPPGAVGVSIALETIMHLASTESFKADNSPSVLICSKGGGGLLNERMELVSELWNANIRAEILCAPAPSLTEHYEYANENGIKWLAIITEAGPSHTGSVKVRHLDLKRDFEVPKGELVKFFSDAFASPLKKFSLSKP